MKPFLFPQIPRFITATHRFSPLLAWGERCVLWGGIVLLVMVHLQLTTPPVAVIWRQTLAVLASPATPDRHVALAQIHWHQGNAVRAREELMLANSLLPSIPKTNGVPRGVLGTTTTPLDLLNEWEAEPNRLKSEYALWKEIAQRKPEYRDARVTLGSLAYQLGKFTEAKMYLTQAVTLDPNNETAQKLLSILP